MTAKNFILALTLLLLFAAGTEAKLVTASEPHRTAVLPEDLAISTGPIGATLERDYFSAPQATLLRGHAFPCRLQQSIFDKTRLAHSCN